MRLEVGWLCEQRETHHLCRGPSHWANYFLPPINLPSGEKQKIQDRPCTLQLKLGGSLIWFEILWAHVEGQHLEQGHNKRHTEAVISPLQDCFFIHEVTLPDLLNMTLFFFCLPDSGLVKIQIGGQNEMVCIWKTVALTQRCLVPLIKLNCII